MTEPLDDELIVGAAVDIVTALIQSDKLAAAEAPDMLARTITKLRNPEQETNSTDRRLDTLIGWLEHRYGDKTQPTPPETPKEAPSKVEDIPADPPKTDYTLTPKEIKESITPDALICQECGEGYQMLKMHLRKAHDMSREEYLAKYGLPRDYPKMSPNAEKSRSAQAKRTGNIDKAVAAKQKKNA